MFLWKIKRVPDPDFEAGEQRIDVVELNKFAKLYKKVLNYFIK